MKTLNQNKEKNQNQNCENVKNGGEINSKIENKPVNENKWKF